MTDSTSAMTEMRRLRDEFARRLMSNPDYRALVALDKAIAEVQGAPVEHALSALNVETGSPVLGRPTLHTMPSHANAAIAVLKRNGRPMPLSDLLPLVREEGAAVNGKDPEINLSSSLSRNDRLRSVRYKGRSCWWLKDRPYPGETAVVEAKDIRALATTDDPQTKGSRHAPA